MRPVSRWLRVILSRWPGLFICFNCAACPGKMQEAYGHKVCPNFRARRWPAGKRAQPPEPIDENTRLIPLTHGEVAMVDAEDYEELSKYKGCLHLNGSKKYAMRRGKDKNVLMHRQIMHTPEGMVTDHIDGNGLNNHKANMRNCTPGQNACNSGPRGNPTGFRGVEARENGTYVAAVKYKGERYEAGVFNDPVEAARARDKLARQFHGEYAWLNFPEEDEARPSDR
jgi:hypothetical protein